MKHLIVGAGATLGEALSLGNDPEICPPVMRDFARKTWSNYNPHPILELFLNELGHQEVGSDARELFYELEESGVTNVELFMEFVWENRNLELDNGEVLPPGFISGLPITEANAQSNEVEPVQQNELWENLLYHGIGSPLSFLMSQCFFENGNGWKELRLTKTVADMFEPADMVLNLNYDTVFELALTQLGQRFAYSPYKTSDDQILVCKPHGSLNMVCNDTGFTFGQPDWLGMPQPPGYRSYSGLIPPRSNKSYSQHPIARMILAPVLNFRPETIVFWGVGFPESDADLLELYAQWSKESISVDIINPDPDVATRAMEIFACKIRYFADVSEWIQD